MAGRKPKATVPVPVVPQGAMFPSNALVASAVRYTGGKAPRVYMPATAWQREAYRHYGICGEARFAAMYYAHSLSRVSLYAATMEAGLENRLPADSLGNVTLGALFNGPGGQAQMLAALGTHLTIGGECYVVGRSAPDEVDIETGWPTTREQGQDVWEVVSPLEMHVQGEVWTIKYGDGQTQVPLTDEDIVIRIWRPHPANRLEADSPFRSLLPVLTEIEWLTKHIFAQASSRLTGAGLLFLDEDMTFPTPPTVDGKPQEFANTADQMLVTLGDMMMAPIVDPESPAALVPGIVTGSAESIAAAKLMHFWTDLDEKALEMRNDAIHRFALGMDLPIEKVLGVSGSSGTGGGNSNGVSHWGAWQIDEETVRLHIEPMLELICNSLTMEWMRLATNGGEFIRADTANLRLRPDRSKEAFELWERMVISTEALLRECGFSTADMPKSEEIKTRMLQKIASGSATPEQVQAALKAMGIDLPLEAIPTSVDITSEPREARPAPSLEDHPTRPRTPLESSALLAASEALVFRALERAGNRLRQLGGKPVGVPSYETHTLVRANGSSQVVLEDAFSCAPQILSGIADSDKVVPILEAYCVSLLAEQAPHERGRLEAWLDKGMAA